MIKSFRENILLILLALSKLFDCVFTIANIAFDETKYSITDFFEFVFSFSVLVFIVGGFFVNENNKKIYHTACRILIPLRIIFGEAGLILKVYIDDILYLVKEEGIGLKVIFENEDWYILSILLSYCVTVIFESYLLKNITEHKVNKGISEEKNSNNHSFINAAVLYGLFSEAQMLHMYIVRLDSLSSAEGVFDVICLIIPGLFLLLFIAGIKYSENIRTIKLLEIQYIISILCSRAANLVSDVPQNFEYPGISHKDAVNIVESITALIIAVVLIKVGEKCFSDKVYKTQENQL